eukprot:10896468-Alexandrium_andersonii.AAC.1
MNCDNTLAEDTNMHACARRCGLRHVCDNENKNNKKSTAFPPAKHSGKRGHLVPNVLAKFPALSGSRGNAH